MWIKKISSIPPLYVNGKFGREFSEKVIIFGHFLALPCTTVKIALYYERLNTRQGKDFQ